MIDVGTCGVQVLVHLLISVVGETPTVRVCVCVCVRKRERAHRLLRTPPSLDVPFPVNPLLKTGTTVSDTHADMIKKS